MSRVVTLPTWSGWAQTERPKRENARPPLALHLQDGSGRGQVPPQGWRDRDEEHSWRRPERQTGVEEVDSVETEACKSGNSSVGDSRWGCPTIGVMCTVGGARTTRFSCGFGLPGGYYRYWRTKKDQPRWTVSKYNWRQHPRNFANKIHVQLKCEIKLKNLLKTARTVKSPTFYGLWRER